MTLKYTSEMVDTERQRQIAVQREMESRFADGIAIYGAGFVGAWACEYLRNLAVKVTAFIDRDLRKIGGVIQGIPVIGPDAEDVDNLSGLFIAARHAVQEVERNMGGRGFPVISFDGYFVLRNYERLLAIRDRYFDDERSAEVFNALLLAMLTGRIDPCPGVMEKDMYFCLPEFSGNFDEAFVDAGAFVGDTVERFIWENLGTFRHIHAFEPGLRQFNALEKRMQRLAAEWAIDGASVSLVRAGLSNVPGRMTCTFLHDSPLRHGLSNAAPGDASNTDDETSARVLTLDAYLDGRPVTFIKADVEGMEMELLRGATQTIRACRPKMALCIYHYPSHLYEIAEYVKSLVPEYQLSLRHHAPLFGDFVLYCRI